MAALLPHTTLEIAKGNPDTVLADGASAQGIENRKAIPARAFGPEAAHCAASDTQKTDHEPRWQDKNCRNPSNRTKGPFGVAAHVDGSARRVVMQHAPRAARFTKAMGTSQLEDRGDRSLRFCSRMAV